MKNKNIFRDKVDPINLHKIYDISDLINAMTKTGFQGRKIGEACVLFEKMLNIKDLTIILGYSGSLSVAGQSSLISWMIENNYIDIIVSTGANISEDLIFGLDNSYYRFHDRADDEILYQMGYNRYFDLIGKEKDYLEMTELIAEFIFSIPKKSIFTSREFLYKFGIWLGKRNIDSVVTKAAQQKIPIYCPAISDSPYGDASLITQNKNHNIIIDSFQDYIEFMSLAEHTKKTGVFLIGGGVPKDFAQLFAVTPDLLYDDRKIPNKKMKQGRAGTNESYYPHEYAIQFTTDSPQWGGLSGCSFDEAVSWGKENSIKDNYVQCFCDATISLPILLHYINVKEIKRKKKNTFNHIF